MASRLIQKESDFLSRIMPNGEEKSSYLNKQREILETSIQRGHLEEGAVALRNIIEAGNGDAVGV